MIVGFKGQQNQGKTSLAVRTTLRLLSCHGYEPWEVVSNVKLNIQGTHFVASAQLVEYMMDMVKHKSRHKILILDEVDRIFPHRFWHDKEQTEALLGLWQDVKLFHWILWTAHLGGAVDLLIRQCTQVEVIPKIIKPLDMTTAFILDCVNLTTAQVNFWNISAVFKMYDRWATVDGR